MSAEYSATSMLRTCVVPDLGDELIAALVRLNAVLLDLDGADPDSVPPPVTGGAALAAFDDLWNALCPTQRQDNHLIAPDGFSRHKPLSFLGISIVDLDILGATAQTLGLLLARGNEIVRDTLGAYTRGGESAADVVADIACIHGLLDLRATSDTRLLQRCVCNAEAGTDVMLSPEANAAYVRTIGRLNQMWSKGSGIPG